MNVPAWLHGVAVATKYVLGNNGTEYGDVITLSNLPGGGFGGTYVTAGGVTGTITGIAVGQHPSGGVVVVFHWSEPGWCGEETLHYWQDGAKVCAWGSYTQEQLTGAKAGDSKVGQEWTP